MTVRMAAAIGAERDLWRYFDPELEPPPEVVGTPSGVLAPGVAWSVGAPSAPPVMLLPDDDDPLPAAPAPVLEPEDWRPPVPLHAANTTMALTRTASRAAGRPVMLN
ncbi:hypothetical protein ASE07_12400 [Noviherbaspirillum sp. Root189]|nr:hypothetical protein ASE07_12400 [Noviherbaspirillum sp. Root189]